jgi:hypothetical protein
MIGSRRETCLAANIVQVFIQVPSLFHRYLWKQDPRIAPMYEIQAMDTNLYRPGVITSLHGRKHRNFYLTLVQFITPEGREAGVFEGGGPGHGPDRFFQGSEGDHSADTTPKLFPLM